MGKKNFKINRNFLALNTNLLLNSLLFIFPISSNIMQAIIYSNAVWYDIKL